MSHKENVPHYISDKTPFTKLIGNSNYDFHRLGSDSPKNALLENYPLARFSPQNRRALTEQRDHSACSISGSPTILRVRKTRDNLRNDSVVAATSPPCLQIASRLNVLQPQWPLSRIDTVTEASVSDAGGQGSIRKALPPSTSSSLVQSKTDNRHILRKVKDGITGRQRSRQSIRVSDSSTSLIRRLSERWRDDVEQGRRAHSLDVTRPSLTASTIASSCGPWQVPYIDLLVQQSVETVAANTASSITCTVVATVKLRRPNTVEECLTLNTVPPYQVAGCVTSLRLCYKPLSGCSVTSVSGQKAARDLVPGQKITIEIEVYVPVIADVLSNSEPPSQDCLMAQLQSMLGILHTEVLAIEAKYRHSLLPIDNVSSVRRNCSVTQPDSRSVWSMTTSELGGRTISMPHRPLSPSTLVLPDTVSPPAVEADSEDTARQIWRKMRRSSLSTAFLHSGHAGTMQQVTDNRRMQELQARALANKRSVGADTLLEWQYEDRRIRGDAPWM